MPVKSISRSCIANARAVAKAEETFTVELLGRPYTQGAFKYQVKCLAELRAAYAKLGAAADAILSENRMPVRRSVGRKILFITTDQQRFDSLGCNGNKFCRTPNIDALAANGINYTRAYNQNTVCMPARSTMLTGQYVRTHGVFANGVPLPRGRAERRAISEATRRATRPR